jgi:hypothetical protein
MINIKIIQKRNFRMTIIVLLLTLSASAQENWNLVKEEAGIKVYTKTESGSKYKSFKTEMQVNCKILEIVEALKNVNNTIKWGTNSKEVKLLKSEENDQYYYIETSIPWPFNNRDMVYHLHYTEINNEQVKVTVTGIPEYTQPREGIVRMVKADGYWLLDPIDTCKTVITYQMHVEPGGSVPAWLANLSIVNIPLSLFMEFRNMVQKSKYDAQNGGKGLKQVKI